MRNRLLIAVAVVLVIVVALVAGSLLWMGSVRPLPLEREVTFVTGPLRSDGFVDYYAALRELRREGVTPENNLFVELLKLLGPGVMLRDQVGPPEAYFEELGIEPPPPDAIYFPEHLSPVSGDYETVTRPWQPSEFPRVYDVLAEHGDALDAFVDALRAKDGFYAPMPLLEPRPVLIELNLASIQQSRNLARVLSARAMLRLASGDLEGAHRDVMAQFHLAKLVPEHPLLIELLIGYSVRAIASGALEQLLSHPELSSEQALQWLAEYEQLPNLPPLSRAFEYAERMFALDSGIAIKTGYNGGLMDELYPQGGPPGGRFMNLEHYSRRVNSVYDSIVAALAREDFDSGVYRTHVVAQLSDIAKEDMEVTFSLRRLIVNPQAIGHFFGEQLLAMTTPAITQVLRSEGRALAQSENHRAAFALAAWYADHGQFPARLEDLVPDYLSTEPIDIYSGRPLAYVVDAEGALFYSFGPNQRDDGGRDVGSGGDDFGFRLSRSANGGQVDH